TAIALDVEQAIALTITDRGYRAQPARSKIIQFLLPHAVDAMVAAHPQVTGRVFEDLKDAIVEEPVTRRIACELAIFEATQSSIISADPESPLTVFVERPYHVAWQPVALGPACESIIFESRQTAVAPNP